MQRLEVLVESAWADHRAALVRRLTALTRDINAAEDLTQEAFLRLACEVEAGRAPDNAGAWLNRVAANLVASRGRHMTVIDRRARELPYPDAPATPEARALRLEAITELLAAMSDLSETGRGALMLAAYGYRGAEIAASLGRTEGAVRTILCRARGKMRDRLESTGLSPT